MEFLDGMKDLQLPNSIWCNAFSLCWFFSFFEWINASLISLLKWIFPTRKLFSEFLRKGEWLDTLICKDLKQKKSYVFKEGRFLCSLLDFLELLWDIAFRYINAKNFHGFFFFFFLNGASENHFLWISYTLHILSLKHVKGIFLEKKCSHTIIQFRNSCHPLSSFRCFSRHLHWHSAGHAIVSASLYCIVWQ